MDYGMIDPLPFHPVYDYSYDGVMRSFDASLHRLGLDRIDILLAHDIGEMQHGVADNARHFADLATGGYKALEELRASGRVSAIGLGVNENEVCLSALEIGQRVGTPCWNRPPLMNCFPNAGRQARRSSVAARSTRGFWQGVRCGTMPKPRLM
jgi:aryl-alcohol dehydrogenase-like predicted oxidoreductase